MTPILKSVWLLEQMGRASFERQQIDYGEERCALQEAADGDPPHFRYQRSLVLALFLCGFRALGAPPIFGVGDPLRNPEDDPLGTSSVDLFGTRLGYVIGAVTETSPVTFRGDVLIVFVKVFDIRRCRRAMSRPVSPPI
jgi:hypothetical protein